MDRSEISTRPGQNDKVTHLRVEVLQDDEVLLAAVAFVPAPPSVVTPRHLVCWTESGGLPDNVFSHKLLSAEFSFHLINLVTLGSYSIG